MTWVKLSKHSDWGHIYYAVKGKGLTKNGTANRRLGLDLSTLDKVTVLFPGNRVERLSICPKFFTEKVSDHGHTTDVSSTLYGVNIDVYGVSLWLDLADPQIKVKKEDLELKDTVTRDKEV